MVLSKGLLLLNEKKCKGFAFVGSVPKWLLKLAWHGARHISGGERRMVVEKSETG